MFSTIFLLAVPAWATPPIADAGPDQTMYSGDILYLQGTAYDPDGGTIEVWQWSISQAPASHDGSLTHADTPTPAFSATVLGGYVISLAVIDSQLEPSAADFMVITVVENQPPEAIAAADVMSGPAPLTVNFDGTGSSDPEGGELYYNWHFGDGQDGVGPYPTHTYDTPGTYHVALIVIDDGGLDDFDIIDITVCAIAPAGDFEPDCDVDFDDFAVFALAWLTQEGEAGWNPACDISIPADNSIDWHDLDVLTDNWLAGL